MFARGKESLSGWSSVLREKARLTAMEVEYAAEYIAAMSERMARDRLEFAVALTTRLPQTFAALRAGTIDEYRARRITEATTVLSDELALKVEAEVVTRLGEPNPRQVNRLLQRVVERVDPDGARERCGNPADPG